MTTRVIIIGPGGRGREVTGVLLDCAPALALELVGIVDDGAPPLDRLERLGIERLCDLDALHSLGDGVHYVAIGDLRVRRPLHEKAAALGSVAGPPLVHPRA